MAQYDLSIDIQDRLTDADQLSDAIGLPVSSLSAEVTIKEPKDDKNNKNKNKNNNFYIYWVIFGSVLTIIVIVVVS